MTSYSRGETHLVPSTKKYSIAPPIVYPERDRDPVLRKKVEWTEERRFNHAQALRDAKARKR